MPRLGNPNRIKLPAGPGRPKGSKNKLTREDVERELRYIALSDPLALFERAHGKKRTFTLRQIHDMPIEVRKCIASIKERVENLTPGDDAQDTTVEIRLWDKTKALELCARSLGMLKDVVQVEGLDVRKERLRRALAPRASDES